MARTARHSTRIITMLGATVTTALCLALGACAGPGTAGGGTGATPGGEEPTFSGPYAADYQKAYGEAPSDLVRNILRDGEVSEAEVQEMVDAFNVCLEPFGLQAAADANGSSLTQFRGSMSDADQLATQRECDTKTGFTSVISIYQQTSTNPDKLDGVALDRKVYQCLKKHDLLPEPISEEEYLATMSAAQASVAGGDQEQVHRRWREFFHQYMETDDNGAANPDYDATKGQRFRACNTDPMGQ